MNPASLKSVSRSDPADAVSSARSARVWALLTAAGINGVGSWASLIAIWGVSSYRLHSTALAIATLALAWTTPPAVLGIVAGAVIDRTGPRLVATLAYLLGAAGSLGLALASTYSAVLIWALVIGASRAFAAPAVDSLPPRLVSEPQLFRLNAALATASNISIVLGPLVAGAIISGSGTTWVFLFDALTYVVGATLLALLNLKPIPTTPASTAHSARGVFEAFHIVRRDAYVRSIFFLMAALYLSWAVYLALEPIYVRNVLHKPVTTFAYLQMTFGIGFILTAIVLTKLRDETIKPYYVALAVTISGLAAAGYIGTHSLLVAFISIAIWGVTDILSSTPARTILQTRLPVDVHGRIFSLDRSINAAMNLALPLAGFLTDKYGVQATGLGTAAIVMFTGLVCARPLLSRRD